ncbi:MAG: HetZ-related protein [Oscillatoriophycideae cyanobacterium NC_groundwater_1537_Pr4_S-0.65um_50_18]|nr:HetZ-related protein [Oscillatoriophycideae cyanobacterium NC_groundwater_1537_Pr4_S-0.65um_50_18]
MNLEPVNSPSSFTPKSLNDIDSETSFRGSVGLHITESQTAVTVSDSPESDHSELSLAEAEIAKLVQILLTEFQAELPALSKNVRAVMNRIAIEVERICSKSDRIQNSGQIQTWQLTLAKHRIQKCLTYYNLGSRRGRIDLHSHLSTMVYRHIVVSQAQMGFSARYGLIEDFLQGFYIEVLKAFRRENELPADYSPRTRLELAEYMAFTEHYAKRRISLPGRRSQQLIVLRAQGFAHRQPPETTLDLELAVESARGEDAEIHSRSPVMQQVREQMVADTVDPTDSVVRDRVISELTAYLDAQGQTDCVDYLILKLQDLSAPEIDEILGLSTRQRDYLQQRFKYHVEKFSRSHRWQLVHQWLGADLDQNLGMPQHQWQVFTQQLTPEQQQLLQLKGKKATDQEIAKTLRCTPKQVHKRWVRLLELAWQTRNSSMVDLGNATETL